MNKQEIIKACSGELTEKQARSIAETEFWKNDEWTLEELGELQLGQIRLVMDIVKFHEAVEAVLERGVWTHEFADFKRLQEELQQKKDGTLKGTVQAREAKGISKIFDMVDKNKVVMLLNGNQINPKNKTIH